MGHLKKYSENFSAFSVAEVTIIFKSGRRLALSVPHVSTRFPRSKKERKLTLQQSKQHISRDRPLVRLIQNENRIRSHIRVNQAFTLEHTIRHVLDPRFRTRAILESNGIANLLAKSTSNLFGDTLRDGHSGHSTRLGASDFTAFGESFFCEILSHLGRFSRASVTDDNQDLVLSNKSVSMRKREKKQEPHISYGLD
jgi:hypothetical protein